MALNPKALEAAEQTGLLLDAMTGETSTAKAQLGTGGVEKVINNFLGIADLVERKEANRLLISSEAERDEAHRDMNILGEKYHEVLTQLAALRDVLEAVKQRCLLSDDDGQIGVTTDPHIDEQLFSAICDILTDTTSIAAQWVRAPEWRRIELGMVPLDKWIMVGMASSDSPTGWWEAPAKIYGLTGRDEEPSMVAFVQHYNGEEPARVYATHWRPYIAVAPKVAEPEEE